MNRPTGVVWVEGRVTRSTRRCISFRALDRQLRERQYYLPRVHLHRLEGSAEDRARLLVPLWWAYQSKLNVVGQDGYTRVVYLVADEPPTSDLVRALLERTMRPL